VDDSNLLERWRAGDQQAAGELFRRYADQLIALARSQLSAPMKQRVDPEDVVQSVYRSFFVDSRAGRYETQGGGDLWRLLVTITLHKLQRQVERHTAQKRAVRKEQSYGSEDSLLGMQAELATQQPSPVEALALTDEVERIMLRLEPSQRRMLELRLQGFYLEEIAELLECSQRTVRRVLDRVKQELEQGQL
jgi:RNA polymerase sigma factor (sigma-70 family)